MENLSASVGILEESPRVPPIAGVPTAVTGVVGITERGPIAEATLVTSWEEYVNTFGGFTSDADVAIAAYGFFLNGGKYLYVVRTTHFADVNDPSTTDAIKGSLDVFTAGTGATPGSVTTGNASPFRLDHGDTLDVLVQPGAVNGVATFNGTAAQAIGGAVFPIVALAGGENCTVDTDDGNGPQTVTAAGGETTALDVANLINSQVTGGYAVVTGGGTGVDIITDKKGTGVTLTLGAGAPDLLALIGHGAGSNSGGGNVADIWNVTFTEVKSLVEAAFGGGEVVVTQEGTGEVTFSTTAAGPTESIEIQAASTADDAAKMDLDNAVHTGSSSLPELTLVVDGKTAGSYSDDLQIRTTKATQDTTAGATTEYFNLQVLRGGKVIEIFPNVTMDDASDQYVETVVNDEDLGSNLIEVTDQTLGYPAVDEKPDIGSSPDFVKDWGNLAGGDDGIAAIVDADYLGSAAGPTGLYCLDPIEDIALLAVPGQISGGIYIGMIDYCETYRDGQIFAMLDSPDSTAVPSAADMVDHVETVTAVLEYSEFAAVHWPQIKIVNPDSDAFGSDSHIEVPWATFWCGRCATNDRKDGGVWQSPAGIDQNFGVISGCVGFGVDEVKDKGKRDLIYPKRINPITKLRGTPRHVDGGRTLKSTGNFPNIGERRGVIYVEKSLRKGLRWAKHRFNNRELRQRVKRSVTAFLLREMNQGAFRSRNPAEAFYVDVSDELNPPAAAFAGEMHLRIGLATNKPAEFIWIHVTQDTRAYEESLEE